MRTSALFGAKNLGFFKIYGVSARGSGVEPVRTKGEGKVNFSRFCADVFYGRPLRKSILRNSLKQVIFGKNCQLSCLLCKKITSISKFYLLKCMFVKFILRIQFTFI